MAAAHPPSWVLIVEDDYAIRTVLAETLSDEGYTVLEAEHGAAALDTLRQAETLPCVVILDLMMPVMTGWEFRMAQSADPRLAAVPVVVLSARSDISHHSYQISVDAFLQKPVDLTRLLDIIQGYCPI